MSLSQHLGVPPDHRLSWEDLTQGVGIPDGLFEQPGLYGIYKGGAIQYVGRSGNLTQRFGQVIGAICGGTSLHSGGYKVFDQWDTLPPGLLHFEIYLGQTMYDREAEMIAALVPPLNG